MLGAIIGDIVGSRFEWHNQKDKHFELFTEDCRMTDDSIMTFAVAKALMETEKVSELGNNDYYTLLARMSIRYMQEFGRHFPDCGFSGPFSNGSSATILSHTTVSVTGQRMRISPVAYVRQNRKGDSMPFRSGHRGIA